LVYELYGLTEKEIALVEGEGKQASLEHTIPPYFSSPKP